MSMRDKILNASDSRVEIVEVPEWDNAKIEVRSTTVEERGPLVELSQAEESRYVTFYPALLIATCYDPDTGEKLFTAEDSAALCGKNSAVVEKVAMVALRMCGLADSTEDELGKG
jgi:hypothetical protein